MIISNTASALFGKARRAVLAILFCHGEQAFYLRQIVRSAGVGYGAVQRELASLVKAGLIVRRRQGNQTYYQANRQSSVFRELQSLMVKTAGVADILRARLASLADKISLAFLYGSVARGSETADSDIDLMIVGQTGLQEVVTVLQGVEDALQREVNPSVFEPEEFRERVRAGEHFICSVLEEPKIFLIGEEHELERVAGAGQS